MKRIENASRIVVYGIPFRVTGTAEIKWCAGDQSRITGYVCELVTYNRDRDYRTLMAEIEANGLVVLDQLRTTDHVFTVLECRRRWLAERGSWDIDLSRKK